MSAEGGFVWQDSPLHQYLQSLEFQDGDLDVRERPETDDEHRAPSLLASIHIKLQYISECISCRYNLCCLALGWRSRELILDECGILTLQSGILVQEDVALIRNLDGDLFHRASTRRIPGASGLRKLAMYWLEASAFTACVVAGFGLLLKAIHSPDTSTFTMPLSSILSGPHSLGAILLPALPSVASKLVNRTVTETTTERLLLLSAMGIGASINARLRALRLLEERRSLLQFGVLSLDSALDQIGRSLRTIQEVELVSRGYAVSAVLPAVSRLERGASPLQCLSLRHATLQSLALLFHTLRNGTRMLVREYPLAHPVDSPARYLAFTSLDDLDVFLSPSLYDVGAGPEHTLEHLKDAFKVVKRQASEFLTRLCLPFTVVTKERSRVLGVRVPSSTRTQAYLRLTAADQLQELFDGLRELLTPIAAVAVRSATQLDDEMRFEKLVRCGPAVKSTVLSHSRADPQPDSKSSAREDYVSSAIEINVQLRRAQAALYLSCTSCLSMQESVAGITTSQPQQQQLQLQTCAKMMDALQVAESAIKDAVSQLAEARQRALLVSSQVGISVTVPASQKEVTLAPSTEESIEFSVNGAQHDDDLEAEGCDVDRVYEADMSLEPRVERSDTVTLAARSAEEERAREERQTSIRLMGELKNVLRLRTEPR